MNHLSLLHLCGALALMLPVSSRAEPAPVAADAKPLIAQAVAAVGGADKLLRQFRMKERYHSGADPMPKGGKSTERESILDAPGYWWLGKKDRTEEPAKFDVWAWTLVALTDARSVVEVVPDVTENARPAFGLRVSGTITPAMELYFDRETHLLVRMDWRKDLYRFSEWKEHDGVKYSAKTIIFKKATDQPWFYHEITALERLKELPSGLSR